MRVNFTLPAVGLLLLSAVACKKDSSGGKSAMDGSWNFTSTSAVTSSTLSYQNEKNVSTSSYTSTDNKGTVTIGGGVMTSKNISYTIATEVTGVYYVDNVEQDRETQDFTFTLPSFSSVASFKTVGADSVVFTGGASTLGGPTGTSSGAKFSISGNTLTMVVKVDTTYADNSQGVAAQKHDVATQTTILTRQ